jgi:prepilin-type N-terminal cleavage/methylation domain-containing protein
MKLNQRGFTLVELMVAAGLLGILTYSILNSTSSMNKSASMTKLQRQAKDIVNEMINTFTTTASNLQVDYSYNPTFPTNLPIAWDVSGERMLTSECEKLKPCHLTGRMGIIVTPTSNKKIYLMKIRITHPKWNVAKVYTYLVGNQ